MGSQRAGHGWTAFAFLKVLKQSSELFTPQCLDPESYSIQRTSQVWRDVPSDPLPPRRSQHAEKRDSREKGSFDPLHFFPTENFTSFWPVTFFSGNPVCVFSRTLFYKLYQNFSFLKMKWWREKILVFLRVFECLNTKLISWKYNSLNLLNLWMTKKRSHRLSLWVTVKKIDTSFISSNFISKCLS